MFDIYEIFDDLFGSADSTQREFLKTFAGDTHVSKDGDKVVVEIEVPGAKAADVGLEVHGHLLQVSWKRTIRGTDEKYQRHVRMSKDVDLDSIKARVEHGILKIELQRGKTADARKINVSG